MKKLVLALVGLLVLGSVAQAEERPWRLGTTHWLDIETTPAHQTTTVLGSFTQAVHLVSTIGTYFAIAASGEAVTVAAEQATASYLPANVPMTVLSPASGTVIAISTSSTGILFITELSR